MCWSKRASPEVSTAVTTTFTPSGSSAVNDSTWSEYCQYPAVECYQDINNGFCSGNGKCCELDDTTRYCVCFSGYSEKYCQTQNVDPWVLESLEANATIGIAVGVGSVIVLVLAALVAFFVIMHLKKKRKDREQPGTPLTPVGNSNNTNEVPGEGLGLMVSDSNHNSTKPTL